MTYNGILSLLSELFDVRGKMNLLDAYGGVSLTPLSYRVRRKRRDIKP